MNLPSADQAPPCPAMSPNLRTEPPTMGILHSGPESGTPCPSITRSSDPSFDRDKARGELKLNGGSCIFMGSPPEVDISSIPWLSPDGTYRKSLEPSVPTKYFGWPSCVS